MPVSDGNSFVYADTHAGIHLHKQTDSTRFDLSKRRADSVRQNE